MHRVVIIFYLFYPLLNALFIVVFPALAQYLAYNAKQIYFNEIHLFLIISHGKPIDIF